ncbi:transcription initiation factor IIB [Halocatena halophila]|uniref:transcription initiation factor IIB n=1 Tax=Halocatena halophila TaxID=2814576 RepID=UPI002ED5216B
MSDTQRTDIDRQYEPEKQTEDITHQMECPECGGTKIYRDSEHGERCCEDCGLVIEGSLLDTGPEWRAFDTTERNKKSRVGSPVTRTLHDKGLTTAISWKDRDGNGRALSPERRKQMRRLRTWHERARTANNKERNLQFALSEIDRMASAMGIPRSIREIASVLYRRALDEDLIRGRSIEGIAAAAVYAACRQEGFPRSLDELAEVSRVERSEIARAYRYIARELELALEPADPRQYIPRFCSALECSEDIKSKAMEICSITAEEGLLSGKSPTGYAAAAIYSASRLCGANTTQAEIANVAQVTEVTIRKRYHEQLEAIGLTIDG